MTTARPNPEGECDEGNETGDLLRLQPEARIGPIADCTAAQRTEARRVADGIGAGGRERDGGIGKLAFDVIERADVVEGECEEAQAREQDRRCHRSPARIRQRRHDVVISHLGRQVKDRRAEERDHEECAYRGEVTLVASQKEPPCTAVLLVFRFKLFRGGSHWFARALKETTMAYRSAARSNSEISVM